MASEDTTRFHSKRESRRDSSDDGENDESGSVQSPLASQRKKLTSFLTNPVREKRNNQFQMDYSPKYQRSESSSLLKERLIKLRANSDADVAIANMVATTKLERSPKIKLTKSGSMPFNVEEISSSASSSSCFDTIASSSQSKMTKGYLSPSVSRNRHSASVEPHIDSTSSSASPKRCVRSSRDHAHHHSQANSSDGGRSNFDRDGKGSQLPSISPSKKKKGALTPTASFVEPGDFSSQLKRSQTIGMGPLGVTKTNNHDIDDEICCSDDDDGGETKSQGQSKLKELTQIAAQESAKILDEVKMYNNLQRYYKQTYTEKKYMTSPKGRIMSSELWSAGERKAAMERIIRKKSQKKVDEYRNKSSVNLNSKRLSVIEETEHQVYEDLLQVYKSGGPRERKKEDYQCVLESINEFFDANSSGIKSKTCRGSSRLTL